AWPWGGPSGTKPQTSREENGRNSFAGKRAGGRLPSLDAFRSGHARGRRSTRRRRSKRGGSRATDGRPREDLMPSAPSAPILCVTPNPALDRTLEVPDLRPGSMMRASSARVAAGGKGVNVARALSVLGTRALCMGPLGGASGRILADLAAAEGLEADWTWCDVETRTCVILVDATARQATVINEAGPSLRSADWGRVRSDVVARAAGAPAVCLSGSLPRGVSPDALLDLCRSLVGTGHAPWVDSSGPALVALLSVPGLRVKINREEAAEALGRSLES